MARSVEKQLGSSTPTAEGSAAYCAISGFFAAAAVYAQVYLVEAPLGGYRRPTFGVQRFVVSRRFEEGSFMA